MKQTNIGVVLFFVLVCQSISAQQPAFERVLVPVAIAPGGPKPGAFGSLWTTEIIGRNDSDVGKFVLNGFPHCPFESCDEGFHPPHTSFAFGGFDPPRDPNAGMFLYVRPDAQQVGFNVRVRDVSRQALTWGTSIPVIRQNQTYTGTLHLLAIPTQTRFRATLRIYDFNFSQDGRQVRLRIFEETSNTPLVDTIVALPPTPEADATNPIVPSAITIGDLLTTFPQLANLTPIQAPGAPKEARIRIDIDPISTDLEFWAFVSVTNNETQHVTVITPDPPPSR